MKTVVNVYISRLETTRNFESNVAKEINSKLLEYGQEPADIIEINTAGMSWEGRGQFKKVVALAIEGEEYNLSVHSTDSQLYDEIKDNDNPTAYSNLLKRLVLDVLSFKSETIAEEVMENRDDNNE